MAQHNNQLTVGGCDRGDIEEKARPGWIALGGVVPSFGATKWNNNKNGDLGGALALGGCRSTIFHTTTNQKEASGMQGSMKGRCNEQEVRGKCNIIVLGALEVR